MSCTLGGCLGLPRVALAEGEPSGENPSAATTSEVAQEPAKTDPAPRTRPQPSKAASLSAKLTKPGAGSEQTPMFGTFEGNYALGGLATGISFGPASYYLGGEVSVVRQFREFAWLGAYLDGVYDFGRQHTRLSIGPEVGWSALGLDGGYLVALDGSGARSGLTVRPMLTMGYVTGYARLSHLFEGATWLEAGVLLKYPVEF